MGFKLITSFKSAGGQAEAIEKLALGLSKFPRQTLLGITGSGKTFVMAKLIERYQRPTLVLAHNKTLAAQLYSELRQLFPENRVEYFISYYDYYQPESYIPTKDIYIEKEATVNEQIEKMRLKATASLMSRDDVIIVASISCIYGLGDPANFSELSVALEIGQPHTRTVLAGKFVEMQYERNDEFLEPGRFRLRGDIIDIIPAYDKNLLRIGIENGKIAKITELDSLTYDKISELEKIKIFPARQFVVPEHKIEKALQDIEDELVEQLPTLGILEQERLRKRTKYDIEMIREIGYCSGIENYSRHFDNRKIGQPPFVLLDYFPKDFLLIIDESHQTLPQAHAMYKGDYSRKKNLVDFGFRLPCAFDNRPLKFEEFEKYFNHTLFVSATPSEYETKSSGQIVELIIRPTGLLDPLVEIRPVNGQIADLIKEIKRNNDLGYRTLVTTLTKRSAEELTDYLAKENIKVRYMHSEIESLERIEIIKQLRTGDFDVLVGINLLREGLDLPEVALIAILDADKEGFLRDERSLIQTIGRAARNVDGRVILYADTITRSMREAMAKTRYRREQQIIYNKVHGITPESIKKSIEKGVAIKTFKHLAKSDIKKKLIELESEMFKAAEKLDFEKAIELRDLLNHLKKEHSLT